MRIELLEILRCPLTLKPLVLEEPAFVGDCVRSGWLSSGEGPRYAIRDFVPRFVPASNYADSFGMQWNKFRRTQLDSYSGHPISENRFWKATAWKAEEIAGKWVVDAGCGAGRFAEIALRAGARLVALDYSTAIDACNANLMGQRNLHAVQADIYSLPFLKGSFSYVYSLGVLQHTPDVGRAFAALAALVAPGGKLCVDVYQKSWSHLLRPKYLLRPITKRIPEERLFKGLQTLVPKLLRVSGMVDAIPIIGPKARRLVPVADLRGILPLSPEQHLEWSLLDTFDWFSPQFDNPQSPESLRRWFEGAGMSEIEVLKAGHLVGRAKMRCG